MQVTFLGTGTSYGVPMLCCDCEVCHSNDPRDKRLRTALWLQSAGYSLLIDTPPDLRTQCLTNHIRHIHATLLTHAHADHLFGLDDLRPFTLHLADPMPVYASPHTVAVAKDTFQYLHQKPMPGTTLARIELFSVPTDPTVSFVLGPFRISSLPVVHGRDEVVGWKILAEGKQLAYIPDCKLIPETTWPHLTHLDVMILDALRRKPHSTHLSFEESIHTLQRIGAKESYLVHMSHDLSHVDLSNMLPERIHASYDGLTLTL